MPMVPTRSANQLNKFPEAHVSVEYIKLPNQEKKESETENCGASTMGLRSFAHVLPRTFLKDLKATQDDEYIELLDQEEKEPEIENYQATPKMRARHVEDMLKAHDVAKKLDLQNEEENEPETKNYRATTNTRGRYKEILKATAVQFDENHPDTTKNPEIPAKDIFKGPEVTESHPGTTNIRARSAEVMSKTLQIAKNFKLQNQEIKELKTANDQLRVEMQGQKTENEQLRVEKNELQEKVNELEEKLANVQARFDTAQAAFLAQINTQDAILTYNNAKQANT
ncbi:hypothetical protein FB567DRAFT_554590 [Paraphoma chrysanthemicola]|uniref:Uncharacterized protein n=1 Tax=Paraphoma chrysanthemicola TaxID=798071 RepID=A0A8K0QVR6_9PLEO|nr:hypothetical protein FB567DRAFT_554590 [Paraphoma chrysanthemicola]